MQRGKSACAAPIGKTQVEGGRPDEGAMGQGGFPAGHAPALHFDFGVVNEVFRFIEIGAQ